jgi:hypothetical protein
MSLSWKFRATRRSLSACAVLVLVGTTAVSQTISLIPRLPLGKKLMYHCVDELVDEDYFRGNIAREDVFTHPKDISIEVIDSTADGVKTLLRTVSNESYIPLRVDAPRAGADSPTMVRRPHDIPVVRIRTDATADYVDGIIVEESSDLKESRRRARESGGQSISAPDSTRLKRAHEKVFPIPMIPRRTDITLGMRWSDTTLISLAPPETGTMLEIRVHQVDSLRDESGADCIRYKLQLQREPWNSLHGTHIRSSGAEDFFMLLRKSDGILLEWTQVYQIEYRTIDDEDALSLQNVETQSGSRETRSLVKEVNGRYHVRLISEQN